MAKRKRKLGAKNKLADSIDGTLIKVGPDPLPPVPAHVDRTRVVKLTRSTLFTAEFEAIIEIIAIDRVYRAMLDRLGRRFLTGPTPVPNKPPALPE